MARPVWTGTISFGLIAIPVRLFNAVRHQGVSFNQLDRRTMSRIRYRKVSEDTGEEVPSEEIIKGFEVSKGRYVVVDPDELEPFIPAATKTIDLEEFVRLDEIDPILFEAAYYLAPHGNPKPYVLLARAMQSADKVAIGRFVLRSRQCTTAIRAVDSRLIMSTLAYADEVVPVGGVDELGGLDEVQVGDREVTMAELLVDSLTDTFDATKYTDDYRTQVLELIAKKAAGESYELPAAIPGSPKVVDLMAALEASVQAAKSARRRHPTARSAAKSTAEPRASNRKPRKSA